MHTSPTKQNQPYDFATVSDAINTSSGNFCDSSLTTGISDQNNGKIPQASAVSANSFRRISVDTEVAIVAQPKTAASISARGSDIAMGRIATISPWLVPQGFVGPGQRLDERAIGVTARTGTGTLYTHVVPGIQHTASIAFPGLWAEGCSSDMLRADSKFALRMANKAEEAFQETLSEMFSATGSDRRRLRMHVRAEIDALKIARTRYSAAWDRFCASRAADRHSIAYLEARA